MLYLTATAIALLIIWLAFRKTPLSHIPGPSGWPFIGVANKIPPFKANLVFTKWAEVFGPVYKVQLPGKDMIVVSGIKAAIEALVSRGDSFSAKGTKFYRYDLLSYNAEDIVGGQWSDKLKLMRKFAHKTLHAYGSGMKLIEGNVQDEIEELIDHLERFEGKDSEVSTIMHAAIVNTMSTLLFGERYEYNSPERRLITALDKAINRSMDIGGGPGNVIDMFPILRFLPIKSIQSTMKDLAEAVKLREKFFDDFVWPHVATIDREKPRGIIDEVFLLVEQEKGGQHRLGDVNFKALILDLIVAGTLTSSNTLSFLVLMLVHHPHVQKEMQREIDEVVGDGKLPSISDKERMPYCQAVLNETLRFASVIPATLHAAKEDSEIAGFFIPKGTYVLFNLWGVHHDPHYWEKPEVFDPTRFLDDSGKLRPKGSTEILSYMPFGSGGRNCVGEILAKNRIFLIMTSLLQRFRILPPYVTSLLPPCHVDTFKAGLVMMPPDYHVRIVARE